MSSARRISAGDTFFAKFFISLVFLGFAVALAVFLILRMKRAVEHGEHPGPAVFGMAKDLVFIGFSLAVVWLCGRLKRVALTGSTLHVSNFFRSAVIPLNEVESVHQVSGLAYRIIVRFTRDTPFGREIYFSPIGLKELRPHPVIEELRAAVANAQRA